MSITSGRSRRTPAVAVVRVGHQRAYAQCAGEMLLSPSSLARRSSRTPGRSHCHRLELRAILSVATTVVGIAAHGGSCPAKHTSFRQTAECGQSEHQRWIELARCVAIAFDVSTDRTCSQLRAQRLKLAMSSSAAHGDADGPIIGPNSEATVMSANETCRRADSLATLQLLLDAIRCRTNEIRQLSADAASTSYIRAIANLTGRASIRPSARPTAAYSRKNTSWNIAGRFVINP